MMRSNLFAALLTLMVFSILVRLGFWQLERGEYKQEIESRLEERALLPDIPLTEIGGESSAITGTNIFANVKATDAPLIYLDNQTHNGVAGYLVYQVVKTESSNRRLLVELGFVKAANRRSQLPVLNLSLPEGQISGRLYRREANPLSSDLMPEQLGSIRIQNLNLPQLEEVLSAPVYPFVLQPQLSEAWPLPQPWIPVPMSSAKHFGYAFQWFVMALVWLGIMSGLFFKAILRLRRSEQ